MINRKNELLVEEKENVRLGKGKVIFEKIVKQEDLRGKGKLFSKITILPGSSIGMHDHTDDFEVYYILKGKAKVFDNGEYVELNEGDVVYTADGQKHNIENIGEDNLEFIALVLNDQH